MEITDTRKCNLFNLEALAKYLDCDSSILQEYYNEILEDKEFLSGINAKINDVKQKTDFNKGIFRMESIPCVDWFAFERILIYVLIRHLKPKNILETGVYYGGNSAFALQALKRNNEGNLVSIDFPDYKIRSEGGSDMRHALVGDSELYSTYMEPGFMIPENIKQCWKLIIGDSLREIPRQDLIFDFYIHDSDHSMRFLRKELACVWEKLSDNALVLVDDIDWSNAFFAFCVEKRLYPLLLTDNGKDNLRVRTGITTKDHKNNSNDSFN